jgi:hypothetical protein
VGCLGCTCNDCNREAVKVTFTNAVNIVPSEGEVINRNGRQTARAFVLNREGNLRGNNFNPLTPNDL